MRYLDTGTRDPNHAIGSWFANEDPSKLTAFRFQTGFFGIDGLSPLEPHLKELKSQGSLINAVVGSNDGDTLRVDLEMLLDMVGAPRANARVAIASFSRGLFHPKVYHLARTDGSQAAYVGSANLTYSAITSINIEAGMLLDTRDGDEAKVLFDISSAIDAWVDGTNPNARLLGSAADLATLVAEGIVSETRAPRPTNGGGGGSGAGTGSKLSLSQLLKMPRLKKHPTPSTAAAPTPPIAPPAPTAPPIAPLPVNTKTPPYPGYILFAPGLMGPTAGASALTGTSLPSGASGLILRLNRDSARHFANRGGTANISIPVPTLSTIRFGVYGKFDRPRAEFDLVCRFLSVAGQFVAPASNTAVMGYGFDPRETGHGDVRLTVPVAPARAISEHVAANGYGNPTDGDAFLLEWPTVTTPEFRATFFDSSLPNFTAADSAIKHAVATGNVIGQASCWMPNGYSPAW